MSPVVRESSSKNGCGINNPLFAYRPYDDSCCQDIPALTSLCYAMLLAVNDGGSIGECVRGIRMHCNIVILT